MTGYQTWEIWSRVVRRSAACLDADFTAKRVGRSAFMSVRDCTISWEMSASFHIMALPDLWILTHYFLTVCCRIKKAL